jgi:hypothetical protein
MRRSHWLDGLRASLAHSHKLRARSPKKRRRIATRRARFELLEERTLLATLTVNSPLDNNTPGDGLVTLREAIIAANADTTTDLGQTGSGADTIQFDATVFATPRVIQLAFGDLVVSESITINGPGQELLTIDARKSSRVFDVGETSVTIVGLTLANGQTSGDGGAIRALGRVTLDGSTVSGNIASGKGGGIYSRTPPIVTNSIISGNNAAGSGGGVYAHSLSRYATVFENSVISGNTSGGSGGGFYATWAGSVRNSRITDNTAASSGGGFRVLNHATLTNSIISGNRATAGDGGGFFVASYRHGGGAELTNATISGNNAGGDGGGFYAIFAKLTNSTIFGNAALGAGGGFFTGGGSGAAPDIGAATLINCTISNNSASSGGGFRTGGNVTLTSSAVNGNGGGGISGQRFFDRVDLTLNSSTVSGNTSNSAGGGIHWRYGSVVLNSSTIDGNQTESRGGGIYTIGASIALNSSTLSGNTARSGGGGVYRKQSQYRGSVSIRHSTITNNRVVDGSGGGVWNRADSMEIVASIVAGNTASTGPDINGSSNTSFSLIGDNAGTGLAESHTPDANGNLIGSSAGSGVIDPRLAPLADNGGPTRTHGLLAGSPAIDAIPLSYGPLPARDYPLNGSLADTLGGPSMVALGGSLDSTGYYFEANQGLNVSSALANPGTYSIEIVFRWNELTGAWYKILDFHNLTSDVGLYTAGNGLYFLDRAFTGGWFAPRKLAQLVITRDDATDIVRAYVQGVQLWSFVDSAGEAVFDGPNQIIRLFQDDSVTSQSQAQSGFVDRVQIYNQVLTATEINTINTPLPFTLPEFDQRGAPFLRVREGDGIAPPKADMGAFELPAPLPPPTVDYGDAPDGGAGAGPGNYNTTASDNGPRHTIVPGLRIGAVVDGDSGSLQDATANADDVNAALPDDEDGVSNPMADLVLTVGANQGAGGFILFEIPGESRTIPYGINDSGQVVGVSTDPVLGFFKDGAIITKSDALGGDGTLFTGINNSKSIVGFAMNGAASQSFVRNGSHYIPIAVPGFDSTIAYGINDAGQIVGYYENVANPNDHGFLWDGATYTPIFMPLHGTLSTTPRGINNNGVVVGSFQDSGATFHGFIRTSNGYVQFDAPYGNHTTATGINDAGQVVGNYYDAVTGRGGGFLKDGSIYTTIDVPGASHTSVSDINNAGQLVGAYSNGPLHEGGFIYTPPATGPTVNLRVSNTTGDAAALYGWIDYNADGVFNNDTERASVAVPSGTNNGVVTLEFPPVPSGFTGTTYARFRLSTDTAAANPVGPASDGEVEDYRVTINRPSDGTANSAKLKKIAAGMNGGPALVNGDMFGAAVVAMGDLDGDGIEDMAVGAPGQTGSSSAGAVFVQFMNADGTVKASQRIGSGVFGAPSISAGDYFGHSVTSLGDLDGDGVTDLAVGASKDDTGGYISGAVYVLFMNSNGTVESSQKVASGIGGGPALLTGDRFGTAVSSIGDLDGDGVSDLAVGAAGDDTGGSYRGALHVLLMNANGTVKASQKIASGIGGGPALANLDFFGGAVTNLGDLDGDGITELAVGASGDDTGGTGRGAAYILFLNSNGTVKSSRKIASGASGAAVLGDGDYFGRSVAALGDLDGDGVTDLAVGAYRDDAGGAGRGAVHVLFLNANGTVKRSEKIAHATGGGPTLANDDRFGSSIAALGDLDGDGVIELAVGAETDNTGGTDRGAVYTLFLKSANTSPVFTSPPSGSVPENSTNVMTVTANDSDLPPQTVTFSIVGGADQAKFAITSGGALSFLSPPNFEAPTDAGGNNVYEVTIQASDGAGGTATQTISVTVTPVNDNRPVLTSADAVSVPENTSAVLTVTATDADLPPQSITFSIVGGADRSRFTITPSGVLSFVTPPDFESPTDANGDNVYIVIVEASDGSLPSVQAILVTVTNVTGASLLGDYNNNGTVDLADYVLWRNGGPLQNEGIDPGAVTPEDYGVWRANFGRTAPGTGQASVLAADSQPITADAESVGSFEPLAARGPRSQGVQSLAWPTQLDAIAARNTVHRPSRRSAFTADRARDEALIAWLASRRADRDIEPLVDQFADGLRGISPSHQPARTIDAFELAFAALARME